MIWRRRDPTPPVFPDEEPTVVVRPPAPPPTALAWLTRGALAAVDASTVVPVLNYLAFGTLAREVGLGLPETVLVAAGVWWVSGQVVLATAIQHNMMLAPTALSVFLAGIPLMPMVLSVLPLFGGRARRLWLSIPLAQTVASVPWATAQRRLPALPEAARPVYFAGYAAAFMGACVAAAILAHLLAAGLPGPVRALLVFVLPMHLLFAALGSARDATAWIAIVLGLVLGPALRPWLADFTLMGVGLGAGTLAFFAVRLWRRLFPRVVP
ncbi:AzlC family ABC transporter permease [Prosthecomicrobium sp. N25]|uniref:AzlC family ABC transporter permease n=1 Tax=Prosthecomicrobium sp. N25 TaxID=3129254 RepID=UPI0030785CAD